MTHRRAAKFCYEYPRPAVTADAVVWTYGDDGWRTLLIQRKSEPFAGRWALPGGFVNSDEPPMKACLRELREETGVVLRSVRDVGVFGDKDRDPRGWTISAAYYTLLPEGSIKAKAGDDASHVGWHPMDRLPKLAFDHAKIIEKARERLAVDLITTPILKPFVGSMFNAQELAGLIRRFDSSAPLAPWMALSPLMTSNLIEYEGKLVGDVAGFMEIARWRFRRNKASNQKKKR